MTNSYIGKKCKMHGMYIWCYVCDVKYIGMYDNYVELKYFFKYLVIVGKSETDIDIVIYLFFIVIFYYFNVVALQSCFLFLISCLH